MAFERGKQIVLAAAAVVLGLVLYRAWPNTSAAPTPSSNGTTRANAGASQGAGSGAAPDVHLRNLEGERPKQVAANRDLFRFRARAAPPPPPGPAQPTTAPVQGPAGPPPPAPIALKFIGIFERPERSEKVAVLRDATGHLFSGPEGSVIEGRFRILRIGTESVEMAYLDGRGRQTIRLSGG